MIGDVLHGTQLVSPDTCVCTQVHEQSIHTHAHIHVRTLEMQNAWPPSTHRKHARSYTCTHTHTHTHTHTQHTQTQTQKPSGAYCDVDLSLEGPQSLRYLCLHQWWQKRHMQGFRIFGIFWNTFIHLYGNTQRSCVNIKTSPFPSTPQTDTPAKNRRCLLFAW